MKVALVHDWLTTYAGSERVVEQMLAVYPQADLFSLVDLIPEGKRGFIQNKKVQTSFLQGWPRIAKNYRQYLPFMPLAIEQFDLSGYDVVISSSHAVAKGVITGPDQLHVCMCYSPMRYAWDLQHQYLKESGMVRGLKSTVARTVLHHMRTWDHRTANGVDVFIAISEFIQRRIHKVYRRPSVIIYPPVDTQAFTLQTHKEDFYLTASRMVPYKHMDLIVEAFQQLPDRRLVVIGDGPEMEKIRSKAGPNVQIMGYQPFEVLKDHMQRARAFIFAAEEDFGIIPVEAQACGTPVIAYGKGGSLETIQEGTSGTFFEEQSVPSLVAALKRFEGLHFDPERVRGNALKFRPERFHAEFRSLMESALQAFHQGKNPEQHVLELQKQDGQKQA